jgi:hypothetical protein
MQRLLNLKSAGSGGADAPPSPGARPPSSLMSRSLDTSMIDEAAAPAAAAEAATPAGAKAGGRRQHGKSLWGKLGSGIKARKSSPATAAARSSFEGASAVELPLPSNGSSAGLCGGRGDGGSAGDEGSYADGESFYSSSPRRAASAGGGNYCDETLDLRHVGSFRFGREGKVSRLWVVAWQRLGWPAAGVHMFQRVRFT